MQKSWKFANLEWCIDDIVDREFRHVLPSFCAWSSPAEVHAAVHDAAVHDDQLLAAAAAEPAGGGDADVSGPGPASSWRRYYKYH